MATIAVALGAAVVVVGVGDDTPATDTLVVAPAQVQPGEPTVEPGGPGPGYVPVGGTRLRGFASGPEAPLPAAEIFVGEDLTSAEGRSEAQFVWVDFFNTQQLVNTVELLLDPGDAAISVSAQNEFDLAQVGHPLSAPLGDVNTIHVVITEESPEEMALDLLGVVVDGTPLGNLEGSESTSADPVTTEYTITGNFGEGFLLSAELLAAGPFSDLPDLSNVEITFGFVESQEPLADLALSIDPGTFTDQVAPGGTVIYPLVVDNNGPDPAAEVVIDYLPPQGLEPAALPDECVVVESILCGVGNLAAGASATITLQLDAAPTLEPGAVVESSAVVRLAEPNDPNPTNNAAGWATTVIAEGSGGAVPPEGATFQIPEGRVVFPPSPKGLSLPNVAVDAQDCPSSIPCGLGFFLSVGPSLDWDVAVIVQVKSGEILDPDGNADPREAGYLVFNRLIEPVFSLEEVLTGVDPAPECAPAEGRFFSFGVGPANDPPVANPPPVCWNSITANQDGTVTVQFAVQTVADPHFSWR